MPNSRASTRPTEQILPDYYKFLKQNFGKYCRFGWKVFYYCASALKHQEYDNKKNMTRLPLNDFIVS